ncbi:uncharacterized protein [Clytia hemisphaerica]|uniref:Uncharacterized protein n=1 Tax=Clytia hemisphaerica TaxID=252671 RepID=A0A7M5XB14_9CNID|eukprot:TCONS_00050246-protein
MSSEHETELIPGQSKTKQDGESNEVRTLIKNPIPAIKHQKIFHIVLGVALFFFILGLVFLIFGVYSYKKSLCQEDGRSISLNKDQKKFRSFLKDTFNLYHENYPNEAYTDPSLQPRQYFEKFVPYDPSWKSLKSRTDHAIRLQKELKDLDINLSNLRPREKKAYAQLEHFLESIFGNPYDENYYTGDWMLGTNYGCWQRFCELFQPLDKIFQHKKFVPETYNDLNKIVSKLKLFKNSIENYKHNIVLGVRTGMVRPSEVCQNGYDIFVSLSPKVKHLGAKGVLKERYTKTLLDSKYYDKISVKDVEAFKTQHKVKNITEKMSDVLLDYLGKPLHEFIEFLKTNHSRHCVPSSVSSGLANLPLKRVWLDQKETDIETTQKLPTGEILKGAKSYEMILPYFTTTSKYDVSSINSLGETEKQKLYKRIKDIAVQIIKKPEAESIRELKIDLEHPRHFFNTTPIPEEENGQTGGSRCHDMKTARKYCPVRYEAMQAWFEYVQMTMARLHPMLVNMFYQAGDKVTTPNCAIGLRANFNPGLTSHFYTQSDSKCSTQAYYNIPFFTKKPGPKYGIYSVVGHETRPGHHTQSQGFNEHFSSSGNNDVIDWLNTITYYSAFTEGWALYAENPLLAVETDLYKNEPLQEYGMIKWQIWRALRLVVDTGLHFRGMKLNEALKLFAEFAWDETDQSYTDVVRYMGLPGQATSYTIGQLAIIQMRKEVEDALGDEFNEKEFHYIILSQGSAPLQYLQDYTKDFIRCKLKPDSSPDCPSILDPKRANHPKMKSEKIGTDERWEQVRSVLHGRHNKHYH